MTKFKVGDQYLTKGGWRAVVVSIEDNLMLVWHSVDDTTWVHSIRDGTPVAPGGDKFSLDNPYTEPRKGTVWVNVYADKDDGKTFTAAYPSENDMESEKHDYEDLNCELIASFKHDWTENEKLQH